MPPKRIRRALRPGEDPNEPEEPHGALWQRPNVVNAAGRVVYARNWVFTLWRVLPRPQIFGAPALVPGYNVDYLSAQLEQAANPHPDNQTGGQHWQGYLELNQRASSNLVRRTMGWDEDTPVWLEPRTGSQRAAINYTKKPTTAVNSRFFPRVEGGVPRDEEQEQRDAAAGAADPGADRDANVAAAIGGNFDNLGDNIDPPVRVETGKPHAPAASEQWSGLVDMVRSGALFTDVLAGNGRLAIQYASGVQKAIAAVAAVPAWRTVQCHYLWGPPGTGKTRYVFEKHGNENVYKKLDGQWWDGYNGESVILFDDFYGDIQLSYLLQLLDGHPLRVNQRGTTAVARWTTVYITANLPFDLLYQKEPQPKRDALQRRVPYENQRYFAGVPAAAPVQRVLPQLLDDNKFPLPPAGLTIPPCTSAERIATLMRMLALEMNVEQS